MNEPTIVLVQPPKRTVAIIRPFQRQTVLVTHPRTIVQVQGVGPPGPAAPPFVPNVIDGGVP